MSNYNEPHYRYVVERLDVFKPGSAHYEALVKHDIDPTTNFRLIWSFRDLDSALEMYEKEIANGFYTETDLWIHRVTDTDTSIVLKLQEG
jgi:hypothetical protein